jgi:hypothetical protein
VRANRIEGNGVGINIRNNYPSSIVIADNNISRNGVGLKIYGAYQVSIFHNFFLNNTRQAIPGGTVSWDDGYPSGGNFWSDYNGSDLCSGTAQNECPDPDGIGDVPYCERVNGSDTPVLDRYPLIRPQAPPLRPPKPQSALTEESFLWSVSMVFAAALFAAVAAAVGTAIIVHERERRRAEKAVQLIDEIAPPPT